MSEAAPIPTYTIERKITDSDSDFLRRQRLSSMFSMFQDIAAFHAANLGASVEWLYEENNLAWIVMRVRVEIDQYPTLAQDVYVDTWPQKPRALYDRDYKIRDMDGNVLVRAASVWIIMDLGTRDIKRDKFLDYFNIELNEERALEKAIGRLKPIEGTDLVYEKEVKFTDVDYNTHTNNAKYIDWIMDMYSIENHRARTIKAIEVHYVNETSPGDIVQLRLKKIDDQTDYIECIRKADDALVINAMVEWL